MLVFIVGLGWDQLSLFVREIIAGTFICIESIQVGVDLWLGGVYRLNFNPLTVVLTFQNCHGNTISEKLMGKSWCFWDMRTESSYQQDQLICYLFHLLYIMETCGKSIQKYQKMRTTTFLNIICVLDNSYTVVMDIKAQ